MNSSAKKSRLRKAVKRYRKPYDDSANIKQTDMKQTFFDYISQQLTALPNSHRNEVLFFATALFCFLIFCQLHKTHFHFLPPSNPTRKKLKSVFANAFLNLVKLNLTFEL